MSILLLTQTALFLSCHGNEILRSRGSIVRFPRVKENLKSPQAQTLSVRMNVRYIEKRVVLIRTPFRKPTNQWYQHAFDHPINNYCN
jgi:hypothetical protein